LSGQFFIDQLTGNSLMAFFLFNIFTELHL
jgi:hypothetical protein